MHAVNEILSGADLQPLMSENLELITESGQQIPGGITFRKYGYRLHHPAELDDLGVLFYNYDSKKTKERKIELRFCLSNKQYCNNPACKGGTCQQKNNCRNQQGLDVLIFQYPAGYLKQMLSGNDPKSLSDELLAFKRRSNFTTSVNLCSRTRGILDNIVSNNYTGTLQNIYLNSQLQSLLLYGLECLVEDKSEESFACSFLAQEEDKARMLLAKDILMQRLGDPITIKELSKKVGTNECYLKKGFKAMFGTTIFDFYQNQRMNHARYLLYEKGLTVTEVSDLLGYSSISHFSTAFKKHTGLKPCELLLR
jgi:AraC-like DNA-binding protein